jgi:hypothetical protein
MFRCHLSIQRKGQIGVQLFLQLEELAVPVAPFPWLPHEEYDFPGSGIFRDRVNYIDVFDWHG